jgi:hypothetical protein
VEIVQVEAADANEAKVANRTTGRKGLMGARSFGRFSGAGQRWKAG